VTVLWGNPGQPQTQLKATVRPAPYQPDARRRELMSELDTAGTI
jgi:vanillate/3-O-methylgallate O-demethylase